MSTKDTQVCTSLYRLHVAMEDVPEDVTDVLRRYGHVKVSGRALFSGKQPRRLRIRVYGGKRK